MTGQCPSGAGQGVEPDGEPRTRHGCRREGCPAERGRRDVGKASQAEGGLSEGLGRESAQARSRNSC